MATHVPRRRKRKHPGRPTKARPAAIQHHRPEPGATGRSSWRTIIDKWASALTPLAKVFSALASIVMSITGHPPPK